MRIYRCRMKTDESFRDLKDLLNIDKIMNKRRENMEKIASLVLLSYPIGLLIREVIYTEKTEIIFSFAYIA